MENFKNKYCVITLVIGLAIGFLAGMEYKAYQIRSAFNEVTEEIGNMFGGKNEGETEVVKEDPVKEVKKDERTESTTKLRQLVDVDVVGKGFTPSDFMNGVYEASVNFDFEFTNKTDKDVRGVQGTMVFYDIFDNEIYSSVISYDEGISANESFIWKAGIEYNEFMDDHQKLRSTELENLRYEWVPETVIFSDGSKEQ